MLKILTNALKISVFFNPLPAPPQQRPLCNWDDLVYSQDPMGNWESSYYEHSFNASVIELTDGLDVVVDERHDVREHSLLGLRRVGHEDDVAELGGGEVGVVGRVLLLDAALEVSLPADNRLVDRTVPVLCVLSVWVGIVSYTQPARGPGTI